MILKKIIFILFILAYNLTFAQSNLSFRVIGFGINPLNDINKHLYKQNFIDSTGLFVFEPGLQITGEIFGSERLSFKFAQAYMKDQIGYNSGYSQLTVNFRIINKKKHYLQFGFGPVIHYRKNWSNNPLYKKDKSYYISNLTQFKVSWLSGEIEYNIKMNKKTDFVMSINNIQPRAIGLFLGVKYWVTRKHQNNTKCPSLY